MKLTKDQRHTAYIIMQHLIETGQQEFMCNTSLYAFDIDVHEKDGSLQETYPEIMSKRPKSAGYSWFGGKHEYNKKKRVALLQQCIEETY